MCMSTHEMTTKRIEQIIENLTKRLATDRVADYMERQMWRWRLEGLEEILKERAESGAY